MTGRPRGIPTVYRGVQFRSRIEARWAAFFDKLKWDWECEPIDLSGYIPDFVLAFSYAPLLVEVKNAIDVPAELEQHKPKIVLSSWEHEAVIVGARIGFPSPGEALCGLFGERHRGPGFLEWAWDDARLFRCVACRGVSVHPANGSWRCRRCGTDDGNRNVDTLDTAAISEMWNAAGNDVQWKGPRL
jgi:hypothetical protein